MQSQGLSVCLVSYEHSLLIPKGIVKAQGEKEGRKERPCHRRLCRRGKFAARKDRKRQLSNVEIRSFQKANCRQEVLYDVTDSWVVVAVVA